MDCIKLMAMNASTPTAPVRIHRTYTHDDRNGRSVWRTLGGEVEERRLLPPVGQLDVGVAQLVEEGVRAGLQRGEAGRGRVLQQARAQGDGLRGRARSEHLRGANRKRTPTSADWREVCSQISS